jgi:hypothetical protein|tara:strand:+ start:329 stop:625 length:297 start_codon:yes stop_codon:yes gene_type:complete
MKALLVDGLAQSLSELDISGKKDLELVLGVESVVADSLNSEHQIFFDEDCFIKQTNGRFQIDALPPISGKAVLARVVDGDFTDVTLGLDQIESRVKFL